MIIFGNATFLMILLLNFIIILATLLFLISAFYCIFSFLISLFINNFDLKNNQKYFKQKSTFSSGLFIFYKFS